MGERRGDQDRGNRNEPKRDNIGKRSDQTNRAGGTHDNRRGSGGDLNRSDQGKQQQQSNIGTRQDQQNSPGKDAGRERGETDMD